MRAALLSFVILALLVGGGIVSYLYVNNTSRFLSNQLSETAIFVRQDNWTASGEKLNWVEKSWKQTSKRWSMIVDHEEIDKIEMAMVRLREFVQEKDKGLALAELAAAKKLVEHIPVKEGFNLANLF